MPAVPPSRSSRSRPDSVPARPGRADAGLRPHLLRQEAGAVHPGRARCGRGSRTARCRRSRSSSRTAPATRTGTAPSPSGCRAWLPTPTATRSSARTDEIRPRKPPITAPGSCSPSTAPTSAAPGSWPTPRSRTPGCTMKAMFCFSKAMPSTTATMPSATVVMRDTCSSAALSALPFLITVAYRSCDTAEAPDSVRPGHHREDGRERHRRDEAEEDVAADRVGEVDRRHVAAAEQRRPWRRGTAGWSARR